MVVSSGKLFKITLEEVESAAFAEEVERFEKIVNSYLGEGVVSRLHDPACGRIMCCTNGLIPDNQDVTEMLNEISAAFPDTLVRYEQIDETDSCVCQVFMNGMMKACCMPDSKEIAGNEDPWENAK